MQVTINLDKDFERFLHEMWDKYGEDFITLNGLTEGKLSFNDFIDSFVDKNNKSVADVSVDGSSNVGTRDIVTLRSEMSKPHEKLLAYSKIFHDFKKLFGLRHAKKWFELEWNKGLYLHDANSATFVPYCFAYDLTKIATDGLFYLPDHKEKEPPKHLKTFCTFVKEFISFTSNRTSGACGLPNLIIWMYYFWKIDCQDGFDGCEVKDPEKFAKGEIQQLIYAMNQPYTRDGIQSAFINTSQFDHEYLMALFGGLEFPDGTFAVDQFDEIMQFQKWFLEEMTAIKDRGRMFTFPVNSISLLRQDGKFIDEDFARWASAINRKWNDSNFFCDSSVTSLSNCCRLKSSIKDIGYFDADAQFEETALKEMYENYLKQGQLTYEEFCVKVKTDKELSEVKARKIAQLKKEAYNFGGLGYMNSLSSNALKVGSVKVSTINLARIAYESEYDEKKYLKILADRVEIDLEALEVVRHIISRNTEKGLLPNFTEGIIDFEHLYNTIGVNGIYEVMKSFGYTYVNEFGNTMYKPEAYEFGKKIFETIRSVIDKFTEGKDYKANIEQVPGETAAVKFQDADTILFSEDVIDDLPLYGNQWIPLGINTSLAERIKICSAFDSYCNGGSILHANIDRPFDTDEQAWNMLNYITDQGVTYFAFNGKLSTDDNGHLFYGDVCPECGAPKTAEYTRTVGFYTKTNHWSKERKAEYKLRKWMPMNEKGIDA